MRAGATPQEWVERVYAWQASGEPNKKRWCISQDITHKCFLNWERICRVAAERGITPIEQHQNEKTRNKEKRRERLSSISPKPRRIALDQGRLSNATAETQFVKLKLDSDSEDNLVIQVSPEHVSIEVRAGYNKELLRSLITTLRSV